MMSHVLSCISETLYSNPDPLNWDAIHAHAIYRGILFQGSRIERFRCVIDRHSEFDLTNLAFQDY